jgi:FtsX-like permease family protein
VLFDGDTAFGEALATAVRNAPEALSPWDTPYFAFNTVKHVFVENRPFTEPRQGVYGVVSYDKAARGDFQQEDMIATLTTLFGALGAGAFGDWLYSVMAYMVEQRTGEIGVRMALGADRGRVLRMVLRGAFSQVAIGLAIGIPAPVRAGKLMTQQLRSVRPWDPVMLASATLALGLAAGKQTIVLRMVLRAPFPRWPSDWRSAFPQRSAPAC